MSTCVSDCVGQTPTPNAQLPTTTSLSRHAVARTNRLGIGSWKLGVVVCALAASATGTPLFAQEGHPLVGTWRGEWGHNAKQRHDLTLVMEFDGKMVTGLINPGFESMKLIKVALDPATWTVRFDSETKDGSGKAIPVVIQAKFEDLPSRHRSLLGTWVQGTRKGDFRITLD